MYNSKSDALSIRPVDLSMPFIKINHIVLQFHKFKIGLPNMMYTRGSDDFELC